MKERMGIIKILFIFLILAICIITTNFDSIKTQNLKYTKTKTTQSTVQNYSERHQFNMPLPSIFENPKIDTPLPNTLSEIQIEKLG